MKFISGLLTIVITVSGITTVALTIHSLNNDFYGFLPAGFRDQMTDHLWLRWVAAGVLIVAVLLRYAIGRQDDSAGPRRRSGAARSR